MVKHVNLLHNVLLMDHVWPGIKTFPGWFEVKIGDLFMDNTYILLGLLV